MDEGVDGRDHTAIGRRDDRRVVAGSDQGTRLADPLEDPAQDRALAEFAHRRVVLGRVAGRRCHDIQAIRADERMRGCGMRRG